MRKTIFGVLSVGILFTIAMNVYAQTSKDIASSKLNDWERAAEQGDTAALHNLIYM